MSEKTFAPPSASQPVSQPVLIPEIHQIIVYGCSTYEENGKLYCNTHNLEKEFQDRVNDALRKGWELHGEHKISITGQQHGQFINTYIRIAISQTMILYKKQPTINVKLEKDVVGALVGALSRSTQVQAQLYA
jgi:hypothetical protein